METEQKLAAKKPEPLEPEVDRAIPLPTKEMSNYKYPFNKMKVGESFHVDCDGPSGKTARRVRSAAANYGKRNGCKFITRAEEGGIRVWRLK